MRRISLLATITLYASVLAANKVTPLNLKVGLWEVTTTTVPDDITLLARFLEKLTPEQRARAEERMKARKADPPKTVIARQCLTRKDLERGTPFRPFQKSCRWTVLTSTGSELEMRGECVHQGAKTGEMLRLEALSPEEVEGSEQFSTNGDTSLAKTSSFRARWIGPWCKTP
jgi:Protein of unknown function (DUF3617)